MLEVSYSLLTQELSMEGSSQQLRDFVDVIERCLVDKHCEVNLITNFDPSPYDRALNGLKLVFSDSKNEIRVVDDCLIIEGNEELFKSLAMNLPYDAEDPTSGIPYHIEYDRISFGHILNDNSLDMNITKKRED
ncbi:hypothetical protein [Candidatus Uabimicrobium amorphum]|uniref:Uncharacterized protein n=1 Tax=Uabimicrobium amorphum TaxID=2596890 RepID=A0A5S9F449_UABAM|nr:hypothetical protein [Candidatus Uabimicrobium amorphum]BBM85386.1 hypothetical protein UABAM_03753 [Candidatus Uabimicrobium amorphum]